MDDLHESPKRSRGRPVVKTPEEIKRRVRRYAALYYQLHRDQLRDMAIARYRERRGDQPPRSRGRPSLELVTPEDVEEFRRSRS